MWTAGSTWADFGLHAAIISHLAVFDRMPLDLPVASGTHLTYPFLVDYLSALYLRGGWSLHSSLFLPGILLALACCQLLLSFSLRLFGHVGAAVSGLVLVLLIGSAGGLRAAYTDWSRSGRSLLDFLAELPRDYTVLGAEHSNVTNFVANALLPQRSILFGLGVGLTVLILLHSAHQHSAHHTGERRYLIAGGVLIGLLPMAHPHTFIVCGVVLAALAAQACLRRRRLPWGHLAAGGIALGLAAPQLAWQQLANGAGTGGRWRFGWMRQQGESIWAFWWANFGVMGIFFVALPVLLLRPTWRHYLVWYLPFLVILVLTQVYAFQPFEYDNLKLIYYVYLMAGLFAGFSRRPGVPGEPLEPRAAATGRAHRGDPGPAVHHPRVPAALPVRQQRRRGTRRLGTRQHRARGRVHRHRSTQRAGRDAGWALDRDGLPGLAVQFHRAVRPAGSGGQRGTARAYRRPGGAPVPPRLSRCRRARGPVLDARSELARAPAGCLPEHGVDRLPAAGLCYRRHDEPIAFSVMISPSTTIAPVVLARRLSFIPAAMSRWA